MTYRVFTIIFALISIAAFGVGRSFHDKSEQASTKLKQTQEELNQAQNAEKEATSQLKLIIERHGDLSGYDDLQEQLNQKNKEYRVESEELQDVKEKCAALSREVSELEENLNRLKLSAQSSARTERESSYDESSMTGSYMPTPNTEMRTYEDRSSLDPMIRNMQALRCREESSKLYQKRLLTLLPMIRNGADVNITLPETKGNTALHYSCAIGSWSITQWLVLHGANVNAVTYAGKTPLDCVGSDNAKRIRELLISRGAVASNSGTYVVQPVSGIVRPDLDPMIRNMQALRCREESSKLYQKRLLTLLPMIRNGADVNITLPETKGNTALHYSCAIGSWSITQWLVLHGANVNAVTHAGKTPLDCVGSDNAKRIRDLLISRGARNSR